MDTAAYDSRVDFSFAFTPDLIAVFVTLFVLEMVLGVDNVIFISILASKLPKEQQAKARNLGLTLAMVIRVILVLLRRMDHHAQGGRLRLVRARLLVEGPHPHRGWSLPGLQGRDRDPPQARGRRGGARRRRGRKVTFASVITQILALDIVFSLDSVITASA